MEKAYNLLSQFRCGGSDGYIGFLDYLLYNKQNDYHISNNYEIKIFEDPVKFREALRSKNSNNKARMLAGYCYEWVTKNIQSKIKKAKELGIREEEINSDIRLNNDIIIGNFAAKWNLANDNTWIVSPKSFDQVGCIHTSQGLELDYCGVIIGKDLRYENNKLIVDKNQIARSDRTSGIRTCKNDELAKKLILNTYRTLLTRGQKGCYIFCEDVGLSKHICEILGCGYSDNENMLTDSQKKGLTVLKSGKNCFVTGEAGTGKSYLISRFVNELQCSKRILRCAPTGIAAKNIHGCTIHRAFQPPMLPTVIGKDVVANEIIIKKISRYDIIIIDEISMCRIDLFEYVMHTINEANKNREVPIQIVLCGDFFQLPPVLTYKEKEILEKIYNTSEGFVFESPLWGECITCRINLTENVRQGTCKEKKSGEFIKYLNNIRSHQNEEDTLNYFNNKTKKIITQLETLWKYTQLMMLLISTIMRK